MKGLATNIKIFHSWNIKCFFVFNRISSIWTVSLICKSIWSNFFVIRINGTFTTHLQRTWSGQLEYYEHTHRKFHINSENRTWVYLNILYEILTFLSKFQKYATANYCYLIQRCSIFSVITQSNVSHYFSSSYTLHIILQSLDTIIFLESWKCIIPHSEIHS